MDKLLPSRSKVRAVEHHAALPYGALPAFLADLSQQAGIGARALEVTILTALRTSEVINASWNEIDLEAAVWTVPAARMKMRREHKVPLPAPVIQALHDAFKTAMDDPKIKEFLDKQTQPIWYKNPSEFRAFAEEYFEDVKPEIIAACLAKG